MDLALGIPTRQAATRPELVHAWVEHAESGPYRSIAVTERITDGTLEPLTMLAWAAGRTQRVRLLASVIVAPTREVTLLARQAAALDVLSGGRLALGLGVGARPEDYHATGAVFTTRGRTFDAQLARLRAIWRMDAQREQVVTGPSDGGAWGPELLVGGYVDAVARRIADFGDGYMAPGGGSTDPIRSLWTGVREAWSAAGRAGAPRLLAGSYYALGPRAGELADAYVEEAYGHDPQLAAKRRATLPTDPGAVRGTLARAVDLGVHEFVLRPCAPTIDQADRLTQIVAG
jgi:alkanesulfonate monooxygenase SsuD/methylene tetrahydromethanopterin reductase-like flavin-dependent oxidoreductase (luciferase family)